MNKIALSEEERKDLVRLGRQIKDVKGAIRVRVILALDAGYTNEEVAKILQEMQRKIAGMSGLPRIVRETYLYDLVARAAEQPRKE